MHNLKALDLFAGTGWGVACQRLGIDEMGVEIMPEAVATREANGMHTIYNDVWEGLTGPSLRYDLLIASPPCQTFSLAGKGAGRAALDEVIEAIELHAYKDPQALKDFGEKHDPRTALVLTPLAHVWRDRPRLVTFEQVPTVLPVWEACATVMRDLGYDVKVAVLNAEQYGVPQTRRRAILVARLDGEAHLPTPTHSRYYSNKPARLDPGVKKWVSMADALGWGRTTPSPTFCNSGHGGAGIEWGGNSVRKAMRAQSLTGEQWQQKPDVEPGTNDAIRVTPAEAAALQSYPTALVGFPRLSDGKAEVEIGGTAYRARDLRPADHPAQTVTEKARSWKRFETDGTEHRVTVEEAGALQTFEQPFVWTGTKTKQFLQIGNAVPPLLAQAILTELAKPAVAAVHEPDLLDLAAA